MITETFQLVGFERKQAFQVFTAAGVEVTSLSSPTVKYSINGDTAETLADPTISAYNTEFKRFLITIPQTLVTYAYNRIEVVIIDSVDGVGILRITAVPDLGVDIEDLFTDVGLIKTVTDDLSLTAIGGTVETALDTILNPAVTTTNVMVLIGSYEYEGTIYSKGETFDCITAEADRGIALGVLEATE